MLDSRTEVVVGASMAAQSADDGDGVHGFVAIRQAGARNAMRSRCGGAAAYGGARWTISNTRPELIDVVRSASSASPRNAPGSESASDHRWTTHGVLTIHAIAVQACHLSDTDSEFGTSRFPSAWSNGMTPTKQQSMIVAASQPRDGPPCADSITLGVSC